MIIFELLYIGFVVFMILVVAVPIYILIEVSQFLVDKIQKLIYN